MTRRGTPRPRTRRRAPRRVSRAAGRRVLRERRGELRVVLVLLVAGPVVAERELVPPALAQRGVHLRVRPDELHERVELRALRLALRLDEPVDVPVAARAVVHAEDLELPPARRLERGGAVERHRLAEPVVLRGPALVERLVPLRARDRGV